jgi:hypothetical protein
MVYLGAGFKVGNESCMYRIGVEECSLLLWVTDELAYGSMRVVMRHFFLINSTVFSA